MTNTAQVTAHGGPEIYHATIKYQAIMCVGRRRRRRLGLTNMRALVG